VAPCGVAAESIARTTSYLKERKQFDRRIGSILALQHRAARMHVDIENAWSATLKLSRRWTGMLPAPSSTSRSPNEGEPDRMRTDRGMPANARRHRHVHGEDPLLHI
jgi:alkylation response protein AidB-like acyl-CoA dehydrogenase